MICCIDANIFIWGIKKQASPGQEEMLKRAEYLFQWMDDNKHRVMIPSIVVAEILAPESLEKQTVILDLINKNFMTPEFDLRAASKYAHMLMNKIEELKKVAQKENIELQKMKTDHLIIACAVANGANCIYTHDIGLKTFGQKYIEIKELPPLPPPQLVQQEIFK